jgi:pimeloyl-ACP methyl ester carboxylesterase
MATGEKTYKRHGRSIYFKKNGDMDFFLQWILEYHTYGGLSNGEGFYIASRIRDGNIEDWTKEFLDFAVIQEKYAKALVVENNSSAASKRYLCASNAYKAATMFMSVNSIEFSNTFEKMEETFQESMRTGNISIEQIEVPFENKYLPGYFYKAKNSTNPPLIMIIGGSDSSREDLYFMGGAEAIHRNYHVAMVDFPGQGKVPGRGLFIRPEMEKPIIATIDWLVANKAISANKIGCYGASGGGYFAMRVAAYDKRIRALALSTPIYDMNQVITSDIPKSLIRFSKMLGLLKYFDRAAYTSVEKIFWQNGVSGYEEVMEKVVRKSSVDLELIQCPVLAITGESESQELKRQTQVFYETVKKRFSQSKYRLYKASEGADAHCQLNNLQLANQELFDWFDSVLL